MLLPKKLQAAIENEGFSIYQCDESVFDFGKYSPAGMDFHFWADTENDIHYFADNILSLYQDFDVSSETYLWLDQNGHGKNGAPYDMKDVYIDLEYCQKYIDDLYQIVSAFANQEA